MIILDDINEVIHYGKGQTITYDTLDNLKNEIKIPITRQLVIYDKMVEEAQLMEYKKGE